MYHIRRQFCTNKMSLTISPLKCCLLFLLLALKIRLLVTKLTGTPNNYFTNALSRGKFNDHLSHHSDTKFRSEKINFAQE